MNTRESFYSHHAGYTVLAGSPSLELADYVEVKVDSERPI